MHDTTPSGPGRASSALPGGRRILAVKGDGRGHDNERLLQGYLAEIPREGAWAYGLRDQVNADSRYYDFYLRRTSYGNDTVEDNPVDTWEALIRAMTVSAGLATLAGWYIWIRLWQLRRRAATWIIAE